MTHAGEMNSPHQPGAAVGGPPPASDQQLRFSDLGRLGRTSWRRHLAGFGVVVGCWIILGGAASFAAIRPLSAPGAGGPLSWYLVVNLPFPFLLAGVLIAVRFVHRRPLRTLVTTRARIDPGRIATAFALTLLLAGSATAVQMAHSPERFAWTFDATRWLLSLPLIVVVTCLQTTAEELFFRGYLLQAVGVTTRRAWLLVLVNSVVFAAAHLGNPEMSSGALPVGALYLLLGAFFTVLTLRDGRLELALGAHAANNLMVALLVNHPNSALPTRAVWQVSELDPVFSLVSFLIGAAVFLIILTRRRPAVA